MATSLLEACAFAVGLLPGAQQLRLVRAAVPGVEEGGADQQGLPLGTRLEGGGDQHRKPGAVRGLELQGDAADLALHAQQRGEVGLVIEPSADGQQIGEGPPADQLLARVAQPGQQGGVDLGDLPVQQGGQVTAGGVLVEVLGTVLEQRS